MLTVVVPCYNYARYLPACLDSVLADSIVERVIVVDDCSTDNSVEVAWVYADRDPRVEIVRHETNRKNIATYNTGLAMVKTPFVTMVSADDMVTPDALTRAVKVLCAEPTVGLVYGGHICVDEHGLTKFGRRAGWPARPVLGDPKPRLYYGAQWQNMMCESGKVFLIASEAVLRTEAQFPYEARLPHSADVEMWLRVAHEWDIAYLPCDQMLYRVHAKSMQMTTFAAWETDLELRRKAFQIAFGKGALDAKQIVAAELAIDRIKAKGERGSVWDRMIGRRLRYRALRATGVCA